MLASLHESFLMAEHKILVADDDPVLTAAVSGALKSHGYTIVVARDAMQAFMVRGAAAAGCDSPRHQHARGHRPRRAHAAAGIRAHVGDSGARDERQYGSHAAGDGARRGGEGIFSEARRSRCA